MRRLSALLMLLLVSRGALAFTITMVPLQSTSVVPGQTFSFDVYWDWSSDPDLLVYGGAFDIYFDSAALEFVSLSVDYNPMYLGEPELLDGGMYSRLYGWSVGDLAGMPVSGRFGTVFFTVRDTMPATSLIWAEDSGSIAPPWVCAGDGDEFCYILPQYNELQLARVPVPPALMLFASALVALATRRQPAI